MDADFKSVMQRQVEPNLVTLTYIIYGLHFFSALTGALTPALVVTAFLTGWPSILAVILNYVKRDDVQGTILESHFRWQLRTFWIALGWLGVAILLWLTIVGIFFSFILLFCVGVWVIYRIVRGVLRLMENRPMPDF